MSVVKKPGTFRIGKTKRDHARGCPQRAAKNRSERNTWYGLKLGERLQSNFPYKSCNGKRNRKFRKLQEENKLRFASGF